MAKAWFSCSLRRRRRCDISVDKVRAHSCNLKEGEPAKGRSENGRVGPLCRVLSVRLFVSMRIILRSVSMTSG